MKIIFNTSNFPKNKDDPTTPFIFHLARAISKNQQVDILAPASNDSLKDETWDNVAIHRFRYFPVSAFQLLFSTGGAIGSLRKNRIKYLLVPFFIVSQTLKLFKLSLKNKYSLIHSHWIIPQGASGLLVSKLLRIPHVVTIHGGDIFFFNNILGRSIKKVIARNADAIVCNSLITKNKLLEITQIDSSKIKIIPAPVELERFRSISKKKKKANTFLFVGRLVEEKGIFTLIKSFSLIVQELPNSHLKIVGDGPDKSKLVELVKILNIPNVTFTGWIQHEDIPFIFSDAWTYVGVSRTSKEGWQEAMGISYVEALASNCNVICNKTAGFLSILSEHDYSSIFTINNPDDINELAKKMRASTTSNSQFPIDSLRHFSSNNTAKEYIKIYKDLKKYYDK